MLRQTYYKGKFKSMLMKLHNIAIVALFWINSNKNKQTKQKQKEKIYLSLIKMIQNDLNDGTLTH